MGSPQGAERKPPSTPTSIAEVIEAEGGRVTFARFMELALTHPTLGYYSRADRLLQRGGDFSTAPAISPFFNRTLARLVNELVDAALATAPPEKPSVVELGGGEGQLAATIIGSWATERPGSRGKLSYRFVEIAPGLRRRQAAAVAEAVAAGWEVGWGSDLASACAGSSPVVVVGNEFLDTFPVHLIRLEADTLREAYVAAHHGELTQAWGEVSKEAGAEIDFLFGTRDARRLHNFSEDGMLEVMPAVGGLFQRVAEIMPSGTLVNIDYGDWFAGVSGVIGVPGASGCGQAPLPEGGARRRRTVRGYFKHQLADPLARPGRQDLTADVDFAAVHAHGRRYGLQTVLFLTLSAFLRAGGAEDEFRDLRTDLETLSDPLEADRQATALENLLDERDLGNAFKLLVQVKE